MPNNLTDVNAFTSPVQVPAGSDDAGLTYLLTAFQALANRTRLLANRTLNGSNEFAYVDAAGATITKTRRLRIPGTALVARAGATSLPSPIAGRLELSTNSGFYDSFFSLPAGVQIVAVRALVTPGAARAGANRMQFGLFSRPIEPFSVVGFGAAAAIGTAVADGGTTNFQAVAVTGLTHTVAEEDVHYVYVQAGNTASGSPDTVTFIEVEYTATGPRSY